MLAEAVKSGYNHLFDSDMTNIFLSYECSYLRKWIAFPGSSADESFEIT